MQRWHNLIGLLANRFFVIFVGRSIAPSAVIKYRSPELVCLHEAGHAITALMVGARVVGMELYLDDPPPHARTRCLRNDEQRPIIALGGFAVERRLWEDSRLLWEDDRRPTEKEMLDESARNAAIDRVSYFGADYSLDGHWPVEMDLEFMMAAQKLGRRLNLEAVTRVASALLRKRRLDEVTIKKLAGL
ncbi:M50 family metallopeptidase [Bradyrhizobium liaoningense]|uniref:M50 family metallopeptidase n=1 Tax=Bradyrhizobium liaoningense TaxID=43992 RepID=UPI001BAD8354|nr:M50 family metallopeptidase [Bradyrhizobium liaoningense]MBR0717868.1 M50 family metallopeptidase [Bradyrhizobium liaoningense]